MARICIVKATGKLIEYQGSADAGTLISNAVNGGYVANEIEERVVTPDEWAIIKEDQIDKPAKEKKKEEKKREKDKINGANNLAQLKNAMIEILDLEN